MQMQYSMRQAVKFQSLDTQGLDLCENHRADSDLEDQLAAWGRSCLVLLETTYGPERIYCRDFKRALNQREAYLLPATHDPGLLSRLDRCYQLFHEATLHYVAEATEAAQQGAAPVDDSSVKHPPSVGGVHFHGPATVEGPVVGGNASSIQQASSSAYPKPALFWDVDDEPRLIRNLIIPILTPPTDGNLADLVAEEAQEIRPLLRLSPNQQPVYAAYLQDFKSYLQKYYEWKALTERAHSLSWILTNEGTAVADDLAIALQLPEDISLAKDASIHVPQPPPRPFGLIPRVSAKVTNWVVFGSGTPYRVAPDGLSAQRVSRAGNSYLEWEHIKVLHGRMEHLSAARLLFPPTVGVVTYEFSYTLFVPGVPDQVRGVLQLEVTGAEQPCNFK